MRSFYIAGFVLLFVACGNDRSNVDGGVDGGTDGGTDGGAGTCIAPSGTGTTHGVRLTQAETWTAATSPHVIADDTSILARVTLEACAVVTIAARKTITVGTGGSIVAQGTGSRPVKIMQRDNGQPWASIRAIGGTLSFTYTQILGGGDPLNSVVDLAAALDIRHDQTQPPAPILHADNLFLQGSASQGIYLHESGAFSPTSTNVIVQQSVGYPIHAWANLVGTIPEGVYTGNSKNAILVTGDAAYSTIIRDVTFRDRGVPYFAGSSISQGIINVGTNIPSTLATLTIEPGVTLRFKSGGLLQIDSVQSTNPATGALVAIGTSPKPITFTSGTASPRAGDWLGIYFGQRPNQRDKLDYVRVEYAGGASSLGGSSCPYPPAPPRINDAAVRIFGEPSPAMITNTAISDSAAHGIDRGWQSDNRPSFLLGGNTFTRIGRCRETYPRGATVACPTNPPCP